LPNRGRKALGTQLLGLAFLLSSPAPANADFLLTDPGSVLYYRAAVVAGSEVRLHHGSEIAGDVLSNGDVDLHHDARVLGDATAAGTVGGHGTVTGVTTSGAAPAPLPSLDVPALLALADRTFTGRTTFSDAVIDDVVFVDGAVRIEGTLAGSGTVVALGDLELVGAGGGLDATSRLSLIASGDVRFAKDRAFRGAVWAGRDLTIEKNGTFEAVMVAGRRVKVKKDTTVTFLHLDPNPPHLTTLSPFDGELLATATPTISVAYSDALSGVDLATLGLRLDGVEVTAQAEVTADGLDFTPDEALAEGEHLVEVALADRAGNGMSTSAGFTVDTVAPSLAITAPPAVVVDVLGPAVAAAFSDSGSGVDPGSFSLLLDGEELAPACTVDAGSASCSTPALADGEHTVLATVSDRAGNRASEVADFEVVLSPVTVTVAAPADGTVTAEGSVEVSGSTSGLVTGVTVGGVPAAFADGAFTASVPLAEGINRLEVVATGVGHRRASAVVTVRRDTVPPRVVIETPRAGDRLVAPSVTVAGTVNDVVPGVTVNADDVTVWVGGVIAPVTNRGFLLPDLPLELGVNEITAVAEDRAGNVGTATLVVTREPDLAGIRVEIVGGNNQSAPIRSLLPEPLAVRLVGPGGEPLPGRPAELRVSRGDGELTAGGETGRALTILTGEDGVATATFRIGGRTGEGFHRVRVTTPGALAFAEFCATAESSEPVAISITQMPPTRGAAGREIADPLAVMVTDHGGNPVAGVEVTFRVEFGGGSFGGEPEVTAGTDADGIATARWTLGVDPGVANNQASASFPGNPGLPAVFVASGIAGEPGGETRITGAVQDAVGAPVVGARVVVRGTELETFTGAAGTFEIAGVPPGRRLVGIDGTTADDPDAGIFFPTIDFPIDAIAGAENALHQVVLLPFLDRDNGRWVGGEEDVTLEMAGVAGFAVKVFAHSTLRPDGTRGPVWMSSSQVKHDRVPMSPPQGSTPLLVGTLQPAGIRFDPPAQVIYPNLEGLPPGEVADVFSFEHSLGQFVNVGPGTVSEDGSVVVSDPGFGLLESGWHCLLRFPGPAAECANGCSAQLEWQLLGPEGIDPGALRTASPVRVYATPEHPGDTRASLRFRPEGGTFDPGGWSGGEPEVLRSEETAAGGTASVTLTAPGALFGDTSLTSPRYRFEDPDGTETSCRAQVDVRVGGVQVVFDQDPAVTGYTLLEGQPPLFETVTATVAPVEMVNAVSFSTDRPDRATVEVAERNPMTGEITLQLYGVTATPTDHPQGDTRVVASLGEEELESAQVVVVVPTTQTHSIHREFIRNFSRNTADERTILFTRGSKFVKISIKDQFDSILNSIYNGHLKVQEIFSDKTGHFTRFEDRRYTIEFPNGHLIDGMILDEAGFVPNVAVPLLSPEQTEGWANFTYRYQGNNNAFSIRGTTVTGTAVQTIFVHGHRVSPDFFRTQNSYPNNHPPVPVEVLDVPVGD